MNSLNLKWLSYLKVRQFKFLFFLLGLLFIITSYIGSQIPLAISRLYQDYSQTSLYYGHLKFLLALFIGQYFVRSFYQFLLSDYLRKVLQSLRTQLYTNWIYSQDEIITKEKSFHSDEKYKRGEFQARLMNDTEAIRELITTGSLTLFIDFIFIISCMVSFIQVHLFYGLVLMAMETGICILLILVSKFMAIQYKRVRVASGKLSRILSNLSNGFEQIFYTKHDQYPIKKATPKFDDFLKFQLVANLWDASYYSFAESLFPMLLALVVIIFPYSEVTSVAILAALIDLIQRSIGPIKDIASKVSNIQRARSGIQRITELDGDLQKYSTQTNKQVHAQVKSLEVEILNFQYPRSQDFALGPFSFSMFHGEKFGIIGKSGCGKSTLLKILSGEVFSDQVKVDFGNYYFNKDGTPKLEDIHYLRNSISLISQDSHLFTETLGFNLSMSFEKSKKLEDFWAKIKEQIPYIKKWGIELEDKIRPSEISLGQKQLISALRFCYDEKPIALFDEISSALDGELEHALTQFLKLIEERCLLIIVAHRLETIIACDQILYLKDGKKVASGKHTELLDFPEYRSFFEFLRTH
jgi:ATP-binding cassette subfamily B protein